jgi:nitrogen fixation protein NifU and related proteins
MREDMQLYHDKILDHYRFARNRGHLECPDFTADHHNPACGDVVGIEGCVADGLLINVVFTGTGCVISQAAASLLTEAVKGKAIAEIILLDAAFMLGLLGIKLGPTRMRCALVALYALQDGLQKCVVDRVKNA